MSMVQRGDVLFCTATDGGEIIVSNGTTEMTRAYESAISLCLGGGNVEDGNIVETEKFQWMGNEDEPEENKLRSRFNYIINSGRSVTSQLVRDLGEAAALDILDCFSGIGAESVESTVSITQAEGKNKYTVSSRIAMRGGDFLDVMNEVFA